MITQLTFGKFVKYKKAFELTLNRVPTTCVLHIAEVVVPQTSEESVSDFTEFVGERERVIKHYTLKCLYRRDFSPMQREKFGYEEDITGVVFLAPDHISKAVGTEFLDETKITVTFAGFDYTASRVIRRGDLFNTCISIEITLVEPHNV